MAYDISEVNIAWVAGFLEGEGCFRVFTRSNRCSKSMHISAQSVDKDVIETLHRRVSIGTICGPYWYARHGFNKQPYWQWHCNKHIEIYELCKKILPYMGKRRSGKIRKMIDAYETEICHYRRGRVAS